MSYGYHFNLEKPDITELEHLISFKPRPDFEFHAKNFEYIKTELKKFGYSLDYSKKYESEEEIIFINGNKKLYFYK